MSDFEETFCCLMSKNQIRRTYFCNYGHADKSKFLTRASFGEKIAKAFDVGSSKDKADYWACALKPHKEQEEHFHVSTKLSKNNLMLIITFKRSTK